MQAAARTFSVYGRSTTGCPCCSRRLRSSAVGRLTTCAVWERRRGPGSEFSAAHEWQAHAVCMPATQSGRPYPTVRQSQACDRRNAAAAPLETCSLRHEDEGGE